MGSGGGRESAYVTCRKNDDDNNEKSFVTFVNRFHSFTFNFISLFSHFNYAEG